jgi:hypothetical protein
VSAVFNLRFMFLVAWLSTFMQSSTLEYVLHDGP